MPAWRRAKWWLEPLVVIRAEFVGHSSGFVGEILRNVVETESCTRCWRERVRVLCDPNINEKYVDTVRCTHAPVQDEHLPGQG